MDKVLRDWVWFEGCHVRKDASHGKWFRGSKKRDERSRRDSLRGVGWAVWRTEDHENSLQGSKGLLQKGGVCGDMSKEPPKKGEFQMMNFSCQKRQFRETLEAFANWKEKAPQGQTAGGGRAALLVEVVQSRLNVSLCDKNC